MPLELPAAQDKARVATILFADVQGFSLLADRWGADRAFATVTGCVRRLDDIARRHGGAVDKYLGDCLMAMFGFPVAAPRAERQAVAAALAMRDAVSDLNAELGADAVLGLKVGINTGPILAGPVGADVVREFAVMGDAVNVAARLKDQAPPGGIFVGAATREAAPGFHYSALEVRRLRGRRSAVRAFAITGREDAPVRAGETATVLSSLVGRNRELEQLTACLSVASEGHGCVAWIEGEGGIGKSRLIAELAARNPSVRFDEIPLDRFERRRAPAPGANPRALVLEDAHLAGPRALEDLRDWLSVVVALPVLLVVSGRASPSLAPLRARAESLGDRFTAIDLAALPRADAERLVAELAERESLDGPMRALAVERAAGNPSRIVQAVFLAEALRADLGRAAARPDRGGEAERRRVTVLFADLSGFTARVEQSDPGELHSLVTGCLEEISGIARRHGGTVEKHLGDCILALFGAPVAIEDAPRAAVNAAIEMRERLAVFNRERGIDPPLHLHTGIDTGLGVAGDISGPLIREFTLMGESVARAEQLRDLAPLDGVWVGAETQRATREWFEYQPVAKSAGVAAFELRSREAHLHREGRLRSRVSSDLVGRDEERARLRRSLAELEEGQGGVVALVAEAGLGKTRLLEEFLSDTATAGVEWYKARSLSTGRTRGFHPFADLFMRWFAADGDDEVLARMEEVCRDLLGAGASDVVPFLATLMGVAPRPADRERLGRIGSESMPRLVLGAVTRLLRARAARGPLVLVFEDLHWADLSSLDLLEALLRLVEAHPILLVVALRPHFPETGGRFREAATAQLADRYSEVELTPLADDAALALLRNLFRGADVPPALIASVRDRARGNPFYLEEVVRTLLDTGAVVERKGALEATARIHEIEVPGTLQDVVMTRVDALARAPREILRAAAAIGGRFDTTVLAEVVPHEDLPVLLERLADAELVERTRGDAFRFRHPVIQEVVYDSLVHTRREELHRAIGSAIEAALSPRTPGYHAMLAFHFSRGRDLERAESHLFRAGDEAARAAASDEALDFFREASALYVELHGDDGDPAKLAVLERNIARALANRGRHMEAVRHFDAALRHRGVRVLESMPLLAARLARDLVSVLSRLYLGAGRSPRRAASENEQAVQELIYDRARAQTTLGMGRYLFDWMDGLRRLRAVDPATLHLAGGQLASTVGIFSYGGVSFSVSERFLRQAQPLVRSEDDEERMVYGFMDYFHRILSGDWGDDHELEDRFVEERVRNGQLFDATNYLAFFAEKRIFQGRFEEARNPIARLAEIADLYQYDLALSSLRALQALEAQEQEAWPAAIRAADLHYTGHEDPLINLLALGNKAKAQLHDGDREGAAQSVETAERLLASAEGVVPPYQRSAVLRSRLLLEVDALARGEGSRWRARSAARAALRAASRVACRRPEVWRLEGRRRWLTGRRGAARKAWRRAAAEARHLGMAPELGRVALEERGL